MSTKADLLDQQLEAEAHYAEADIPKLKGLWMAEQKKDAPNLDVKFQYALLLIKSRFNTHNQTGLALLQELADCNYHVEECFYSLALGLYRMKRYKECRERVELVLRMDPDMPSGLTLHRAVVEAIEKRNVTTATAAAAGIAAVGLLAGVLMSRKR